MPVASPPSPAAVPARRFATQPGTSPYAPALDAALAAAVAALPPDYRPRTRHVDGQQRRSAAAHADPLAQPGAKPNYTNRLLLEHSPYLRQHAHNPVDWRPWGPEAFAEARRLGRPIFLSIGYATCHWCHVMEHESFEDLEIAELVNSRTVPIKVDREERPDVDAIYMAAVQALTGHGGWPMSVFLAPGPGGASGEVAGLPFFAGTYFPPRGGGRRPGFAELVVQLSDSYAEDPAGIVAHGERLAAVVRQRLAADWSGAIPSLGVIDRYLASLQGNYDAVHGGSAGAPKFPSHIPSSLLLALHGTLGRPAAQQMALHTLEKMSLGGIYDHVGGGFARYSTDARWLVPHFEKMLYDQALIGRSLVDAQAQGASPTLSHALRQTMDYVIAEMQAPGGGFYSATDADSEGEEGRFFVWTVEELQRTLGSDEGAFVARTFGATAQGNFEGRNILHLRRTWEDEAGGDAAAAAALRSRAARAMAALDAVRAQRTPPLRDDKLLVSWNGLLIHTLARAARALEEPRYLDAAQRAATWLTTTMRRQDGGLWRVGGGAGGATDAGRVPGHLDDYAFAIHGLLALFEATSAPRWLQQALALQQRLDRDFAAPGGGYFATARDAEALLAREKPDYDGAEPSGNAIAAQNLLRLAALTGDRAFGERAASLLAAFGRRLEQAPAAMPELLLALLWHHAPLREVVLVRPAGSDRGALAPMRRALHTTALPSFVVIEVEEGAAQAALATVTALAADKVARGGLPTAYVCVGGVCKLPTTDVAQLVALVRQP